MNNFKPTWTSPPGETIIDILETKGLSVEDLAKLMGRHTDFLHQVIQGRVALTIELAGELHKTIGGSVNFWMSRDSNYRSTSSSRTSNVSEWLSSLPLSDMVRFGWLHPAPKPSEELNACLAFFDVDSLGQWRSKYGNLLKSVAFTTSPKLDSSPTAVIAWLRQGEIEASRIDCAEWDSSRFRNSMEDLRNLSQQKNPADFIPLLRSLCAASGVAVSIVRAPRGCRASGATRFISHRKALLLLSFRFLSDDHFWFSFFHEAGHLLLHGESGEFIEGLTSGDPQLEAEANLFAEMLLVPKHVYETFSAESLNQRQIISEARRLGISPGILVGQMQHKGIIPRSYFNHLKRRFAWPD